MSRFYVLLYYIIAYSVTTRYVWDWAILLYKKCCHVHSFKYELELHFSFQIRNEKNV